jgi:hypothetical protein
VGTESQHLARARSNEKFAGGLSTVSHADWKIIATFYSALHYVETIIVRSGNTSTDHASRAQYIKTLPALQPIRSDYATLSNYAWEARYDPATDFSESTNLQTICDILLSIKKTLGF